MATCDSLIRDMSLSPWPGHDFMCYTGDNKHMSVVSTRTGQTVLEQELGGLQGWSCAFSLSSEHEVWVGATRGRLALYDLRRAGSSASRVASFDLCAPSTPTTTSQSQSLCRPDYCCNLIYGGTSVGTDNIQLPVQSILPCQLSQRRDFPPRMGPGDEDTFPYDIPTSTPTERLVVCQHGLMQIVHVAPDKSSVEVFNSINSPQYVPSLSSIYDIHSTLVGPWSGGASATPENSRLGLMIACRKQKMEESAASAVPSLRCVTLTHTISSPLYAPNLSTTLRVGSGAVVTGHGVGVAPTRPASCVLPADMITRHVSKASRNGRHNDMDGRDSSRGNCGGDVLLVACPDDSSRSVQLSAVFAAEDVQTLGK